MTPRPRVLFRAGAPGDSSPSRAFPRRGTRWLLAFARFSAQGHQVPPFALFCAGASDDSSLLHAFLRRGIRWLLAFARHFIIWLTAALRRGPLHYWRVGERLKQGLHVTLNEWESGVLYTRQPLMWGWYRANKRAVSSKHGSLWCGAGIVRIREQCLPNTAAADEGLVSCEWVRSQVIVLYTAKRRSKVGGCMLRQWAGGICGDIGTLSSGICTRLSAPPWKGDVRSRADVLSCRFDGWEECGHLVGMSSSPDSRSTADRGQTDSS